MAGPDLSLITNAPNLTDRIMQQQQFNNQQAGAEIDTKTKQNIYATQVLSAAAASNDPQQYLNGKKFLANQGIDVSGWSNDIKQAQDQLTAAKWAQSSFGALANFGVKADANAIAAGAQTNNPAPANAVLGGTGVGAALMRGPFGQQQSSIPASAPAANIPTFQQSSAANPPSLNSPMPAPTAPSGQPDDPVGVAAAARAQFAQQNPSLTSAGNQAPTLASPVQSSSNIAPAPAVPPMPQPPKVDPYDPTKATYAGYQGQTADARAQYAQELEAWKADPRVISAQAGAKASGEIAGQEPEKAAAAAELVGRIDQNLDSMLQSNPNVPQSKWGVSSSAQAYISQNFGDQTSANAYNSFSKLNKAQVLNGIQELVQSGSIRNSKALINLVGEVNAINDDASPDSRAGQIQQVRAEIHNLATSATNLNSRLNGGAIQPYQQVPSGNVNANAIAAITKLQHAGYTQDQIDQYLKAKGFGNAAPSQ